MRESAPASRFLLAAAGIVAAVALAAWVRDDDMDRAKAESADASIGVATMESDGTIVLQLRHDMGSGGAEGYFTYSPRHRDYDAVRRHVGPLVPGESIALRPWP